DWSSDVCSSDLDFLPAMLISGVGFSAFLLLHHHTKVKFFAESTASFVIGLLALLLVKNGLGHQLDIIVIASVMPLVPGLLITNAIRDLMAGHFLSGLSKGAEAFFTALAIGTGVAVVYSLFISEVGEIMAFYVTHLILSVIAAVGFGIIFNAPRKALIQCGIVGMLGWIVYIVMEDNGFDVVQASFSGAFIVAIIGHMMARKYKTPIIVFIVAVIIPLVPGGTSYDAMR